MPNIYQIFGIVASNLWLYFNSCRGILGEEANIIYFV